MSDHDSTAWAQWSQEAEQSLLGSLLQDNDRLASLHGTVRASSFWAPPHRVIFSAVERLILASKPADTVTVFEALRDAGQADDVGLAYLQALATSVPSARNAKRYAEIVVDKALRRAILDATDSVAELVHGADSADDALDRVQSLWANLKRTKASRDPQTFDAFLTERLDHWQALEAGDITAGMPTGLAAVDEALGGGVKRGQVVVVSARTGVGKTALALQILLHVGGQGRQVLMLSQEMTGGELVDRAAAHMGQVHLDRISAGRFQDDDWLRLVDMAERAAGLPIYIDDKPALTLLDIKAKARQVQRSAGGLALVVVDYLQLCSGTGSAKTRHHEIEAISRGLKTLAKELDVCILLLSQLNRGSEGGEPELHHLKESGAIEEDADVVLMLHPMGSAPEGGLLVLAKAAKNRGGMRGRIALAFDGRTQTWAHSGGDVSPRGDSGPPARKVAR